MTVFTLCNLQHPMTLPPLTSAKNQSLSYSFFIEYKRSDFEKQVYEAVTIERVSKTNSNILNMSKWNSIHLRLVTGQGKKVEIRNYERELKEEKNR